MKIVSWQTVKILSLIGILLALYLMYSQLFKPQFQLCSVNQWVNCNAVIKGEVSHLFDIPVPLYGLTGYVVILIAAFLKKPKLGFGMALFGTLFCLRLMIIEIGFLKVLCPVCLLCQLDMIALTILTWLLGKKVEPKVETKAQTV